MKKTLLVSLSVLLVAALSIGMTVAYLTDTDSDVNVMTMGNVSIKQNEQQRVEKDGEFTSELEDFEQGKPILPVTYPGNRTDDTVTIGDYTIELGDKEANYVDKIVTVTNTGKTDAFVRTLVAVPTGGADWEPTPVAANECWLHWNVLSGYSAHWTLNGAVFAEIDGQGYYVWEFVHKAALSEGETTFPATKGFYLDQKVDNDDNGYYITYADGTVKRIDDIDLNETVDILVLSQAVQAAGFADAQTALDTAFGDITTENHPWADVNIVNATNSAELADAVANAVAGEPTVITLADGEYTTNFKVAGGMDITIQGSKNAVLSGQIASTSSTAGTVTLKGVTVNVDENIKDTTGISQTGKSAVALWGNQTVVCENVTFNMTLANSTAITSWWDTHEGTSIIVKDCVFNCNGQRPIRATGNVTVENTVFNDPYRYAVQLTAKTSTASLMEKAIINFNNNTIVDGEHGKDLVYGIQLEGEEYGCHDCVINGAGNTIVNGGEGSTMYYCECGKVDHATMEWNTEVAAVHAN